MKFKRIIMVLISLLCFIGLGITISKYQSQKADQILSNDGLSTQYYVLSSTKKTKIKSLLSYVDTKYNNEKVQLQFKSKYDKSRILIWSNYNLKPLPMGKGNSRYFSKSDFTGEISFAVISTLDNENVVTFQNNHYIKEGNQYYSVIGRLKATRNTKNNNGVYYLSTGIDQRTSDAKINNYKIIVDGLNKKNINMLNNHIDGKMQTVNYSDTYNKSHGINPTKKFLFATFCVVIALLDSAIYAIISNDTVKQKFVNKKISIHLALVHMLKVLILNLMFMLISFFTLPIFFFFSNVGNLLLIYVLVYLLQCLTYIMITLRELY